jgi:hypothetical protein
VTGLAQGAPIIAVLTEGRPDESEEACRTTRGSGPQLERGIGSPSGRDLRCAARRGGSVPAGTATIYTILMISSRSLGYRRRPHLSRSSDVGEAERRSVWENGRIPSCCQRLGTALDLPPDRAIPRRAHRFRDSHHAMCTVPSSGSRITTSIPPSLSFTLVGIPGLERANFIFINTFMPASGDNHAIHWQSR